MRRFAAPLALVIWSGLAVAADWRAESASSLAGLRGTRKLTGTVETAATAGTVTSLDTSQSFHPNDRGHAAEAFALQVPLQDLGMLQR